MSFWLTSTKLFFGGFGSKIQVKTFNYYFSRYGEVKSLSLIRDKKTGGSKGFGFIKMDSPMAVQSILADRPHIVNGCLISVQPACRRESYPKTSNTIHGEGGLFVGGLPEQTSKGHFLTRWFIRSVQQVRRNCRDYSQILPGKNKGKG